ncbi:MAG: DMT family transporter [Synergistaceae bacterium]|nr:DMT family transporter [Synergistaceae bacterium]
MIKIFADLALLYCAFFWGVSFVSMKILVSFYPTCWLLFIRFASASVMVYIFFHKRINKSFTKVFKDGFILGALLFFALMTQTVGLNYIGGGRSAFISAIYVLMVPLMIWAMRKIFPGWLTIWAAVLCVAGMYLLMGEENISGSYYIGDLLTILCAFTFAIQVISISSYTKECDPVVLSFAEFITLSGLAFVCSLIFETRTELINIESLPEMIFTATFCTFGCYMLQICAQKYAEPSHATIIMSLESVFGLVSSIIFLGESITFRALIGCILIFTAVMVSELEPFLRLKR